LTILFSFDSSGEYDTSISEAMSIKGVPSSLRMLRGILEIPSPTSDAVAKTTSSFEFIATLDSRLP